MDVTARKKLNGSIHNAGRSIKRVTNAIVDAVTTLADIDNTKYGQTAAQINVLTVPQKKESPKKKSKGRIAKNRNPEKTVHASLKNHNCKDCCGKTVSNDTGKLVDNVIGANHKLNELLSVVKNIHDV